MEFYEFAIPAQLDGEQLKAHLKCEEVYIRGDKLVIGGELTLEQAKAGLAAHVALVIPEPTINEKLASVGLSIDDLKAALGL